ncbi:hypothetical protein [Nocardiopsis alkaliphila]|uniref:hypothetical protein n=1 Tax=Nocardiopsis alkaliphila TaxID=225762 RepID=UPI000349E3EF|nr:hypothetical protein [Nocardiopsis alkaliphila]
MRFSHLALTLTATAAFSILGLSPALASDPSASETHSLLAQATAVSVQSSGLSHSSATGGVCDPSPCGDHGTNDDWDKG